MSFNSFKDVVGHVESALKFMKAGKSRNEAQGDLAYGNDYYQGHNQGQQQAHHQPPQHIYGQPPHSPPPGWSQQWDQDAHRYYYIEQSTGRSQWEPPVYGGYAQHQPNLSQQWSGQQVRDSSRPHRYSNTSPISPNQGGIPRHDSLPPGCSYDMKTGQIVSSMLPPAGHHSAPVKYW
jgi:hypothetical protein